MLGFTHYENIRLMNALARSIGTKRRYLVLDCLYPLDNGEVYARVTYRGGFVYASRYHRRSGKVLEIWREVNA